MAEKLEPYGYEYYVIDNGWFGEYKLHPGTLDALEKHATDVRINEYGLCFPPRPTSPPVASRSSSDATTRPEIRRAHDARHTTQGLGHELPIQGTSFTARDVADTGRVQLCLV